MRVSPAFAWSLFDLGFRPFMASRLRLHVTGVPDSLPENGPLLICPNHESWWDGFLVRALQRMLRPGADYRAVMLEAEIRAHPFLRLLGCIGLEPGSVASGRRLLRTLGTLSESGANTVVGFFPQGRIRPGSPRPLDFRTGVSAVARALTPVTVLPAGIRIVPGKTQRMDAFVSLGAPRSIPGPDAITPELLESDVSDELDAIQAFLHTHGEDAPDQWPGTHSRIPRADSAWSPGDIGSWLSRN